LRLITPVLGRFYEDGNTGALFTLARLLACASVLAVPTVSLGATFPLAVRWFVGQGGRQRGSGALYVANTVGAAIGSLSAGFVLLPALGHFRTTVVGAVATSISTFVALLLARRATETPT